MKLHGVDKLDFYFSIAHLSHPRFPELLYLNRIKDEAPVHQSIVARQCNGIIISTKGGEWKIVCYGLDWFPMYAHEERFSIDWKASKNMNFHFLTPKVKFMKSWMDSKL